MASAIGKSNEAPYFRMSAGARLTVIRSEGKAKPALRIAVRTRSRLSRTAESGRPTVVNAGKPLVTSTSTRTSTASIPTSAAESTRASTPEFFGQAAELVNARDLIQRARPSVSTRATPASGVRGGASELVMRRQLGPGGLAFVRQTRARVRGNHEMDPAHQNQDGPTVLNHRSTCSPSRYWRSPCQHPITGSGFVAADVHVDAWRGCGYIDPGIGCRVASV